MIPFQMIPFQNERFLERMLRGPKNEVGKREVGNRVDGLSFRACQHMETRGLETIERGVCKQTSVCQRRRFRSGVVFR